MKKITQKKAHAPVHNKIDGLILQLARDREKIAATPENGRKTK